MNLEKRTRSQLALPDDVLQIPYRSPMKNAKRSRTAPGSSNRSLHETEDDLPLSLVTPDLQDEYSGVLESPSYQREVKRIKRDTYQKRKDTEIVSYLPTFIDDSGTNANAINRRRSKKPSSTVSTSPPPSIYSPVLSSKRRAHSVPLSTASVDVPRIDFRNPPPTPRSGSSPEKQKLRISEKIKSSLPTITDEQTAMDLSDGSTSVPEEKELPIITLTNTHSMLSKALPTVPVTPATASLNELIPMSPLTPIAETPYPGRIAQHTPIENTADRYSVDAGWNTNFHKKIEALKVTTMTTTQPSTSSRLPRPVASSQLPILPANPGQSKMADGKSATAKKRNAFDVLMKRPLQKAKVDEKAKSSKAVGVQNLGTTGKALMLQGSIFASSERPVSNKPSLKMREKMRPRSKSKIPTGPLLIPFDDDEETIDSDNGFEAAVLSSKQSPDPSLSEWSVSSTQVEVAEGKGHVARLEDVETSVDHPSEATDLDGTSTLLDDHPVDQTSGPSLKLVSSKLPLGKKRLPASTAAVGRVTRSVSRQKDQEVSGPIERKTSTLKRTASGKVKQHVPQPTDGESVMDTDPIDEMDDLPPGSPMKTSSPSKTPPRNNISKTSTEGQTIDSGTSELFLTKSPNGSKSFIKLASTPSPSKIARATSMFVKPTITNLTRTLSVELGNTPSASSGSSLSTLSNALEKLRMPPPPRPSTSMGFNENQPEDDDTSKPSTKDDATLIHRSSEGLKRSATFGAGMFSRTDMSSNKGGRTFVQKPLSAFISGKGVLGSKLPHFGIGGHIRRTISKKSSLPMVVGSPAKGRNDQDTMDENFAEDATCVADSEKSFVAPLNGSTGSLVFEDLEGFETSKGIEKETGSKASLASRRVSVVSHALSQSLNAVPKTRSPGLMGPPPTPTRIGVRSASSQYPGSTPTSETASPRTGLPSTRSSARIAMKIANEDVQNSSSGKDADVASSPKTSIPEPLKILNKCVVFVDVRTDEGDEAGSLFVEMLEGIGAKVLSRVGQTCTHIVYKNGLMSTLTRYRMLRDPKPIVVGIGWVVECVEQRTRVDETSHLVDLENVNVAGINKRRRSFLPKFLAESSPLANGENVEDGREEVPNASASHDDDLAPLERARRRKSMIFHP